MLHNQPNLQLLHTDSRLDDLFAVLDEIHTAASERLLHQITPLSQRELVGWLEDLIFTAQETIAEIKQAAPRRPEAPKLRVLEKYAVDDTGGLDAS